MRAMLDLGGADHAGDHAAELLQRQPEADDHIRAREHVQIGRHEGRRVDEAEARHAEHAVEEMRGVIDLQLGANEAVIGGFALFGAVKALIQVFQNMAVRRIARRLTPRKFRIEEF